MIVQVAAPQGAESELAEAQWQFQPMRAPGHQLSEDEISSQLSRFGYQPELYGIRWRSAELVKYVFQSWYQELLDMGNIQVSCLESMPNTCA